MKNTANRTRVGRLLELVEDWKFLVQREGLVNALPTITHEITQLPYKHLKFFIIARSLSDPLPNLRPRIDLEILPFEESHLELIRLIDRPSSAKLCARRLALGHQGFIAFYQNTPVGYAWGCAEMHPAVEQVPIQLEPGDVLCTDVYTNPAYRGKGVQTALSLARFKMFRELGFCKAICYIEVRNAPSISVWQRKLGGQIVGDIDFIRIGLWYRVRCQKAALREAQPVS